MTKRGIVLKQLKKEAQVWRSAIILMAIYIAFVAPALQELRDTRVWRDMTYSTPFRDVKISEVTSTSMIVTVAGTLIKSRDCKTIGYPQVQTIKGGISHPATFMSGEPKGTPQSRPYGTEPQEFGPWIITSTIEWPDRVRMYRSHDCNDGEQTNEVFDIPWPKAENNYQF